MSKPLVSDSSGEGEESEPPPQAQSNTEETISADAFKSNDRKTFIKVPFEST